ncbi:hypothetical protein SAMN05444281_2343 [Wenyingzhuangia marina]|uniref:Lipoprotein n=2 Tax=Wenyingzhuangia marina TaxID=1195760 RepID=A0A1M5WEK0_9FLAO|nr:hypothetical protein GCM10011397_25730 [Wenyingzhuangia marina]SHH85653.1 hypothetical protein SAMN05444281_2343 [Wenyingzhuangia marina]
MIVAMKKLCLLFVTAILLISCEIQEEIYLHNDGSGNINFVIDYGNQLSTMKGFVNSNSKNKINIGKKTDTIIYFKDFIDQNKDSIGLLSLEDQKTINELKNFSMRMNIDPDQKIGKMAISNEFKHISKLGHFEELMQKASSINNKNKETKYPIKYNTGFDFKRKKFKRFVIEKKLSKEDENKYQANIKNSKLFFSGINYKLVYHFDRKIKKVTNKDAVISDDKKTLEISYPMDTLTLNPYLLEFEVTLK